MLELLISRDGFGFWVSGTTTSWKPCWFCEVCIEKQGGLEKMWRLIRPRKWQLWWGKKHHSPILYKSTSFSQMRQETLDFTNSYKTHPKLHIQRLQKPKKLQDSTFIIIVHKSPPTYMCHSHLLEKWQFAVSLV